MLRPQLCIQAIHMNFDHLSENAKSFEPNKLKVPLKNRTNHIEGYIIIILDNSVLCVVVVGFRNSTFFICGKKQSFIRFCFVIYAKKQQKKKNPFINA